MMSEIKDIVIKALPGRGYETILSEDVKQILNAPHRLLTLCASDLEDFLDMCRCQDLGFRFT